MGEKRALALVLVVLLCGCISIPRFNGNFSLGNLSSISSKIEDILNNSPVKGLESIKPALPEKEIVLEVGQSAEYEGINVTVKEARFTKNLRDFETFKPLDRYFGIAEEGYEFLVIDVRIENKGNKTIYTTAHDFIVADARGNIYSYSVLTHAFEDALELKELKRNECVEGKIVFVVPENESEFKVAYCFNSLADFRSFFSFFRSKWAVWIVRR